MRFELIDRVLERDGTRLVGIKQVSLAEEYLQDHFPSFPVMPGVMMLEAMVQAARLLVGDDESGPMVLGRVRALKYGRFVTPGQTMRVEVELIKRADEGSVEFKGRVLAIEPTDPDAEPGLAASGKLTLRPVRLAPA